MSTGQHGGFLFAEALCGKLVPEWREGYRQPRSPFLDHSGLSAGQHYTDDFAQVNPLRKVPALKDEDFVLAER